MQIVLARAIQLLRDERKGKEEPRATRSILISHDHDNLTVPPRPAGTP
jgi:hypothetical protein